jgi:hypothetical protein
MASTRDSTSKRLKEILPNIRATITGAEQLIDSEIFNRANSFERFMNFENELAHGALSWVALRLNSTDENDTAMLKAFAAAGLNHRNPFYWRALLSAFSEVHFGKKRTKPIKWDPAAFWSVFLDCVNVVMEGKARKRSEIPAELAKRYKEKYGNYSSDALRKLVGQALSPKYNVLLRHSEMGHPLLQLYCEDYEAKGGTWTPEVEANSKRLIEKTLIILDGQEPKKT